MKKVLFFVLFFIELTISGFSQNYSPFKNGYLYQYSYLGYNHEYSIHSMKVDSARIELGDSVFYFNKINMVLGGDNSNLWGNKMIRKTNGDCFFIVRTDTILLKTNVPIGTQWSFISQNVPYSVTFTNYKLGSIFNSSDSIKTFVIANNVGFKDSVKISKQYGIVYSCPFIFLNNSYSSQAMKAVKLEYIYNLNLGKNRLNFLEYFNFNVGDVFLHVQSMGSTSFNPYTVDKMDAMKIVGKKSSPAMDTINYIVTYCHSENFSQKIKNFKHIKTGTITVTSTLYTNETETFRHPMEDYTMFSVDTLHGVFSLKGLDDYIAEIAGSTVYEKNIGLVDATHCVTYECAGTIMYMFFGKYKMINTNDTCDFSELFPVIPDSIVKDPASPEMILYPNPINEETLNVQCSNFAPGNYSYSIKNAMGEKIRTDNFTIEEGKSVTIVISDVFLSAGIYCVSVKGDNYHSIEKIVKY